VKQRFIHYVVCNANNALTVNTVDQCLQNDGIQTMFQIKKHNFNNVSDETEYFMNIWSKIK